MSYAIPTNELTLTDIKTFRSQAIEAGIARALSLGVVRSRQELVVREAHPLTDFPGAWLTEYYISAAPGAVGWMWAGDGAAVGLLPVAKVAVFYKCADAAANPLFTAVRFRVGATGASTKASFFIQLMVDNKLETDVYFSEPIVYDPQDSLFIQAYARLGGAAEELSFGCFIVEKVGATIS